MNVVGRSGTGVKVGSRESVAPAPVAQLNQTHSRPEKDARFRRGSESAELAQRRRGLPRSRPERGDMKNAYLLVLEFLLRQMFPFACGFFASKGKFSFVELFLLLRWLRCFPGNIHQHSSGRDMKKCAYSKLHEQDRHRSLGQPVERLVDDRNHR